MIDWCKYIDSTVLSMSGFLYEWTMQETNSLCQDIFFSFMVLINSKLLTILGNIGENTELQNVIPMDYDLHRHKSVAVILHFLTHIAILSNNRHWELWLICQFRKNIKIRCYASMLYHTVFKDLFTNMEGGITERDEEAESFSVDWLIPQMDTTAGFASNWSQEPRGSSESPRYVQGLKHMVHFSLFSLESKIQNLIWVSHMEVRYQITWTIIHCFVVYCINRQDK